jgi:hypothetical protein
MALEKLAVSKGVVVQDDSREKSNAGLHPARTVTVYIKARSSLC